MVGVVVALLAALLLPQPVPRDGCPNGLVVGIAGSGQTDYGPQVDAVVTEIVAEAAAVGLDVDRRALDYPAISVSDTFGLVLFTGEYAESVDIGVGELRQVLTETTERCPMTEAVLVGYSQGAEVIKRALGGQSHLWRVGSVILLADPTRDPDQVGVRRLGDPSAERPGLFGAVAIPSAIRPLVIDVCAPGDGVCERGRIGLTAHVDGYDATPAEVAPIVISRLLSNPTPSLRPR